jgi:hypothetical protein
VTSQVLEQQGHRYVTVRSWPVRVTARGGAYRMTRRADGAAKGAENFRLFHVWHLLVGEATDFVHGKPPSAIDLQARSD